MLLQTVFMRGDMVVLKDVDGSEVELLATDAWQFSQWVRAHRSEIHEAMRREDNKARRTQDAKMNKDLQSDQHV